MYKLLEINILKLFMIKKIYKYNNKYLGRKKKKRKYVMLLINVLYSHQPIISFPFHFQNKKHIKLLHTYCFCHKKSLFCYFFLAL